MQQAQSKIEGYYPWEKSILFFGNDTALLGYRDEREKCCWQLNSGQGDVQILILCILALCKPGSPVHNSTVTLLKSS